MSHTFSNATNTILRSSPYYDDYYEIANTTTGELRGENYDFHRVLFRPRFGVQARELTQLQTLLQAQIERLGDTQYRNGDRVLGAQLTIDTKATSALVQDDVTLTQFFDRDTNTGKRVYQSNATARQAKITQYVQIDDQYVDSNGVTIANNYLLFQYDSAETFDVGAVLVDTLTPEINATLKSNTAQAFNVFAPASTISVAEGVLYISGLFVRVRPQTIVLDPLTNSPSFRVGFTISEQILDELDDVVGESLLDPANNNAVGAHRFRVRATLTKKLLTDLTDVNFIEIARVENGNVKYTRTATKFVRPDELTATLARRTYDESGDYVVRNFKPVVISNPDDLSGNTFNLALSAGKAYVRGYEIDAIDTTYVQVRKGRDTETAQNRSLPLTVGNYVYVSRVTANTPSNFFGNTGTVDLHCVHTTQLNTANSVLYGQSKIGTAKIRMIETYSVPPQTLIGGLTNSVFANTSVYKLFFYDADFSVNASGNIANATTANTIVTLGITRGAAASYPNALPNVNNALDGMTVVLGGSSSPVSGAYTIDSYAANSTGAFLTLKEGLAGLPNANTTYRLLFQTRDVDAFASFAAIDTIAAPYTSNLTFQADVTIESKYDGLITGWTRPEATTDNALLYQLPESFIKANTINVNAAQFSTWIDSSVDGTATLSSAANAAFSIVFPNGSGTFSLPAGTLSATTARRYFTIFDVTDDSAGRGSLIQFADASNANTTTRCITSVSVTGTTLSATYCHGNGNVNTTRTLKAVSRVDAIGYPVRTKILRVGNTTHALANTTGALLAGQIEFTTPNVSVGAAYSLKTPDVVRLAKVLYHANGSAGFANSEVSTATDVTAYFTLDTGQRDNTYEYARAIVKSGASNVIAPTGRLLFIFDWFQHSGIGYATVDSYYYANSTPYTYDSIPSYTSPRTNRTINLRDTLDFRPARSNYDFLNTALVLASSSTTSNTTYTDASAGSTFGQAYLIPVSDDVWIGSYDYYLGRIDKIALYPDGTFHVVEGQPSTAPTPPAEDNNGLLMYQLTIPPYTIVNANDVPTTVRVQTFDHKRYTMKDITKIEDRVAHLEYYTALSQLERTTRDQSIPDPTDATLQRFKNGFIVDAFGGFEVADTTNTDFAASIDTSYHTLHPAYDATLFDFFAEAPNANSTSTNVTRVGDMVIPTYNVEPLVAQTLASTTLSVNPFNIKGFYGTLTLSPSLDQWKSTTSAPAQIIDMGGPTFDAQNNPSFTQWNDWETTWFGVTNSTPHRSDTTATPPGWTPERHDFRSELQLSLSWNDVETTANQLRTGTRFDYVQQSVTQSLGNRVIDTSIIAATRARDVVFRASAVKPGAYLYPFFDKESVKTYVQRANILKLYSISTAPDATLDRAIALTSAASQWAMLTTGSTVYVKKPLTGTITTSSSTGVISGESNTFFDFELTAGQLVRIEKGTSVYDAYVMSVTNSTSATLSTNAIASLSQATVSTLTPVTVADIARRNDGANIEYTLSVVRSRRIGDGDNAEPYAIVPGALRPERLVKDTGTTTNTASVLLTLATGYGDLASINVKNAEIRSGVVRSFDASAKTVRLDLDITDSLLTTDTKIYFVSGPGAGQVANINSYSSSTQTITLKDSVTGIVAGQTIYSVGELRAESYNATIAGYAGTVAGTLHVQDGQFATGERIFRLTDDASNNPTSATTTAEAKFVASGLALTEQNTTITSRYLDINRSSVSDTRKVTSMSSGVATLNADWIDPLAETFIISEKDYPLGVMIDSVDLLFANKPSTEVPVIVELRTTNNGYPTTTIVPCVAQDNKAVAMRYPQTVTVVAPANTSTAFTSSASYTRFSFPSLVHLLPGEYALVVRSDSDEYEVYTALQGSTPFGPDAGSASLERISKQPYAGVLFKSQNGSTWSASQDEDLAFRINRAVWANNATSTGTVILRAHTPESNTLIDEVTLYPRTVQFGNTTSASYTISLKQANANGDIQGVGAATSYTLYPEIAYPLDGRSFVQGMGTDLLPEGGANAVPNITRTGSTANTIDAIVTLSTTSRDVAPYIDMKQFNVIGVQNKIDDMAIDAAQISITARGSYASNIQTGSVSTTSGCTAIIGSSTTFTSLIVGQDVVIGDNVVIQVSSVTNATYFTAASAVPETRVANTYATFDRLALQFSTSDVGTTPTINVQTNYAIVTAANSTTNTGVVTSVVVMDGGSGYITTPSVTVATGSATFAMTGETSNQGGSANTRYITKTVTLADGFDATDIRVWFDGYRPAGTNFYVYYKVLPSDDTASRMTDQSWRLMTQETPDTTISTFPEQYREFAFKTPQNRVFDQSTDIAAKFKVFAIKVAMASNDPTMVPTIRNFRAVALD